MVVLRPTARLAAKAHLRLADSPFQSTTRLGDWYAIDLSLGRHRLVVSVSELSRLAVVMNAAPYASIPERLPAAVSKVLHHIGAAPQVIEREIAEMGTIAVAKTRNRSVVGTMNEYVHYLRTMQELEGGGAEPDLLTISAALSRFVCMTMEDKFPKTAALRLLSA